MNRSFPALRGIAILLVILNHTIHMGLKLPHSLGLANSPWEQAVSYLLSGFGIYAVPIFLYLSGCFFSYAARQDDLKANYRIVWVNLKNIVFPYLFWSLVFYLEIYLVHGQKCTPGECIKQLVVGYPFNFVPLLIFYYLIAPLLILVQRYLGWGLVVLVGLLQLALLNIVSPGTLGFQFPGWMQILAPPVLAGALAEWAIFFPLGLLYVKQAPKYLPIIRRFQWPLIIANIILYGIALLDILKIIHFPLARYICPLLFILLAPLINRSRIPFVKTLESLGKRAYGLYFMNLIVLDLLLLGLQNWLPGLIPFYVIMLPLLFILTIQLSIWGMQVVERIRKPPIHRYIFG